MWLPGLRKKGAGEKKKTWERVRRMYWKSEGDFCEMGWIEMSMTTRCGLCVASTAAERSEWEREKEDSRRSK